MSKYSMCAQYLAKRLECAELAPALTSLHTITAQPRSGSPGKKSARKPDTPNASRISRRHLQGRQFARGVFFRFGPLAVFFD
jgi:hypothetical protein